jgi:hypothetical protein
LIAPAINPPRSSSASNQTRAAENAISQRAVMPLICALRLEIRPYGLMGR